jgi:hypothetical protein
MKSQSVCSGTANGSAVVWTGGCCASASEYWQVGRNENVNESRILNTTKKVCFDRASSIFKNKSKFTQIPALGIIKGTVNSNGTNANQYLLVRAKN